jgi:predicted small metal-binding protein/activator of HSP90 ATPase
MKQFNCKDLGHNCKEVLTAPTEEKLVELASVHLRDAHGVTTMMPDSVAKMKKSFINRAASDAADVVDRIFEKYNCDREPECSWRYITEAEMVLGGGAQAHEHKQGRIIRQSVTLPVSSDRLFDMYLDPVIHGLIAGGPVKISPTVGSEFLAFDGMISGKTIAVVPKKHIVQVWRGKNWKPEDRDSILVLTFLPAGVNGKIELTHLDVPESDFDNVNKGWLDYYWKPWKAYLEKELKKPVKRAA